jgi:hypothetical protein
VQAGVVAVHERRVRRVRQQDGQHGAQPVRRAHRAVGPADADVDVQREGVVAARGVAEPVDDAAVVLGVDVGLLAVVRPRMRRRRAERDAARAGQREESVARVALAGDRVVQVIPPAGDDLDLAGDQLPGDLRVEDRVLLRGGVAQLLEARHEVQRRRVEDRELLLQADGEVRRLLEGRPRASDIDGCAHPRSGVR